jgi:antitoxin (DNA-binding transcriptional repressor) of toxin-antitoxin stability system
MCHMKTASIREVRHDFSRILEWVAGGEEVAITKRRETVARLLPAVRHPRARGKLPDVSARLKKVFGRKMISDQTMRGILDDNRGNY